MKIFFSGGQNVQKVSAKVEIRFHLDSAAWLSEEIKKKFREKHSLTKDGFYIVRSGDDDLQMPVVKRLLALGGDTLRTR